jgi:pimeloyl-ACP methyl ester carboxylesterase
VPLNIAESGSDTAQPIVFVHGLGQSYASWLYQLQSPLKERYHLIAFDLRGHGNSGKPIAPDEYTESEIWAEDLQRVIQTSTNLKPVLVGWSLGAWIALDYVEHYGTSTLCKVALVGGFGGLVEPLGTNDPATLGTMQELRAAQLSGDLVASLSAGQRIARLLVVKPVDSEWLRMSGTMNALLPPYARRAVLARNFDHADLMQALNIPVLLAIGSEDGGVSPEQGSLLSAELADAVLTVFPGAGHSPFVEVPQEFNDRLDSFAQGCNGRSEEQERR